MNKLKWFFIGQQLALYCVLLTSCGKTNPVAEVTIGEPDLVLNVVDPSVDVTPALAVDVSQSATLSVSEQ